MFRNGCTTVPDWSRQDVAGGASRALRGVVLRMASAPLFRGSGAWEPDRKVPAVAPGGGHSTGSRPPLASRSLREEEPQ
jgi:hypothetical protein